MESKDFQPFVLPAIGIVLGLVVLFYIKNKLEGAAVALGISDSPELKKANQDAIDNLRYDEKLVTIPDNEFKVLAQRLLTAMEGSGTDEKEVFAVLNKLQNVHDWNKLQKVFGTPEGRNLRSWLLAELSDMSLIGKSESDVLRSILSKLEVRRYKAFAKNTIKGANTSVTGWDPKTKKTIKSFPDKSEIGVFLNDVILKAKNGTFNMAAIKQKDNSIVYVLKSQVEFKQF